MIKNLQKVNILNIVKVKTSTPRNISRASVLSTNQNNMRLKLKAYQYKNECIEALREGKVYNSAKELRADSVNW